MIRPGRFIVCVALAFLLQTTLVHRFAYGPLRPDLLLLVAAFAGLEAEPRGALLSAFCLGMLRDLGSAGPLGASALFMVPAAGVLTMLRGHLLRDSAWTDLALTFAFALAVGVAGALLTWLVSAGGMPGVLLPGALGQAAFTTALSPLAFAALAWAGMIDKWDAAFGPSR